MDGGKKREARAKAPKSMGYRAGATLVLFLIAVLAIYIALNTGFLGYIYQWTFAIVALFIIGMMIRQVNGLNGIYGMYLIGTSHGLRFIDRVSHKYRSFWMNMALWGVVIGLGVLAYPLLRGKISKKLFAFGLLSLLVTFFFVLPLMSTGLQFITLPQLQSAIQRQSTATTSTFMQQILLAVTTAVVLITGFTGYVIVLLVYNAGLILTGVGQFVGTVVAGHPQSSILSNQIPGAAPLIPGITIPLFAGIVSLAILLAVHELSHGILARIEKIKLKSLGLVIFGIIPMGAFVEPDEKAVEKLASEKQSRIIAAGISANFVAMFVFFVLLYLMIVYVVPGLYSGKILISSTVQGLPAYNVLTPGEQIISWNGYPIVNLSSFDTAAATDKVGSTITVGTPNGTYTFTGVAIGNSTKGYVGVDVYEPLQTTPYANSMYFLYTVFALSLLLNFFVGLANLLPIPGFDGWRLYKINVKNGRIITAIALITGIAILINLAPLFF